MQWVLCFALLLGACWQQVSTIPDEAAFLKSVRHRGCWLFHCELGRAGYWYEAIIAKEPAWQSLAHLAEVPSAQSETENHAKQILPIIAPRSESTPLSHNQ